MTKTSISWTEFTTNPIRFRNKATGKVGHYCEKLSAGCANCYSSAMQKGPYLSGLEFKAENRDKGELYFDDAVLQQVLRRRKPARIFWADCTDLFGQWVPQEWQDRCFATMALTPQHVHQVLTKRAVGMREYLARLSKIRLAGYKSEDEMRKWATAEDFTDAQRWLYRHPWPLPGVHLGVSVENRAAKFRIDHLHDTPAALRFLSIEPLLEDLGELNLSGIGWTIIGGESGPNARPCNVAWIRSIVRQCWEARVPCFVKQLGSFPVVEPCRQHHYDFGAAIGRKARFSPVDKLHPSTGLWRVHFSNSKAADPVEWPEDLRTQQIPEVSR